MRASSQKGESFLDFIGPFTPPPYNITCYLIEDKYYAVQSRSRSKRGGCLSLAGCQVLGLESEIGNMAAE
jgi:hypothetical protein